MPMTNTGSTMANEKSRNKKQNIF